MIHVGKVLVLLHAGVALCAGCGTRVGIAASPSEIYLEAGGTAAINVVAITDIGSFIPVSEPLSITSNDEAIAVVSGEAVTGVAEGTAILTITDGVFSTTVNVHVVVAGTLPAELVATPTSISCTPESEDAQLEVFAVFATGVSEDITDGASYSSSNSGIALVNAEGVVVCIAEGNAVISAQYLGVSDTVEVVVGPVPPSAVNFSSSSLTCGIGELYQVQVLALWDDGSTADASLSAVYSSTDDSVAIASSGQVYCLSEGSATVIANVAGTTGALTVNVGPITGDPDTLLGLQIIPSPIACSEAEVVEVAVIAEYGDGSTADVTHSSQTQYDSSDTTIALIFQGRVLCVQHGEATVQATVADLAASAAVNVQE